MADDGSGRAGRGPLERLFQGEITTKCPETGTGLGLFMSSQVLDKHHGSIDAANRPDEGAVFTVTLPLA